MSTAEKETPAAVPDEGMIPLWHPLRQKIKDALVALSLANLCFIKVSFDLLSDHHRFFDRLPVATPMLLALATNIFCLTLLFWLVTRARHRFPNAWFCLPVDLLFFLLFLYPLDFIRINCSNITDYQIYEFGRRPMAMVCGAALLVLLAWWHRPVARAAALCVSLLSPLAFFLLLKIVLMSQGIIRLANCPDAPVPPPMLTVPAGQPRVLWVIFDETDYRLGFEQRPAGVLLPEFDRLKAQSLFSTDARSPGNSTILSMPALIIGRQIAAVKTADTCDLSINFADNGETSDWNGLPSVFSEAHTLGVNTALVGWYVPYGREIGGALNFCQWYPLPLYEPCRAESFGENLRLQISSLTETIHLRLRFIAVHRDSLQVSLTLVTNAAYGLTLLHLPAPHKPGIYLPDQRQFTIRPMTKPTGYFNNLALADRELGQLRRAMELSGQWDKTWIIFSADHSWRESRLYDNQHDFRVPFLVKAPGTNESTIYPKPFNTILTHDLILAILRGEITNQQNLPPWLDQHGKPLPTLEGEEGS